MSALSRISAGSIILLKRLFAWYYQQKLNRNSTKLSVLRAEKKKIIEKVMDTETYKVGLSLEPIR